MPRAANTGRTPRQGSVFSEYGEVKKLLNIYCDESCHLQYDNSEIMLLGGIVCDKSKTRILSNKIRSLKRTYGLSANFEIKWTKVSPGNINFYLSLLDLFFSEDLEFRCVIAKGKKYLDNEAYNQTYDDWYYKMYYLLLSKMFDPTNEYSVYVDIKDTNGGRKTKKLFTILHNFLYDFSDSCLKKVQIVRSEESELLQLCDLLMGCIGYENRFLNPLTIPDHAPSEAKIMMCQHLKELSNRPLNRTTPLSESKLNIFVWEPRK